MTRKTVVELQAQADSSLPDNSSNLITPAAIRTMIKDFLDSFTPAYGALNITTNKVLAAGLADIPVSPFDAVVIAQSPEFTADAVAGTITRAQTIVTNSMTLNLSFEAPANRNITFTIYKDGAPTANSITVTGAGASNPVSANLVALDYSAAAVTYSVRCRADANNTTVTITGGTFIAAAVPVRTA
jgi:hypothetical protein